MKIIMVSGGHLTPALATIDELVKMPVEIIYVGKHIVGISQEQMEIEKRSLIYESMDSGKIHRHSILKAGLSMLRMPEGLWQALRLINKYKPNVLLSFGGYLSVPLVIMASAKRIPIITHEQTRNVGIANKFNSILANKVAIAFEDSSHLFPKRKTVVVGNPMRKQFFEGKNQVKQQIYVTGGRQGSKMINQTVFEIIDQLVKVATIVHSIGVHADTNEDFQIAEKWMGKYPDKYIARRYFGSDEVAKIMSNSKLVISRSGANTCAELAQLNKACILIPLTIGQNNEQMANAVLLEKLGIAKILNQSELSRDILFTTVKYMMDNINKFRADNKEIEKYFPTDAAANLAQITYDLCKK